MIGNLKLETLFAGLKPEQRKRLLQMLLQQENGQATVENEKPEA